MQSKTTTAPGQEKAPPRTGNSNKKHPVKAKKGKPFKKGAKKKPGAVKQKKKALRKGARPPKEGSKNDNLEAKVKSMFSKRKKVASKIFGRGVSWNKEQVSAGEDS